MAVDGTQPVYPPQTLTPITSAWGGAVSDAVVQKFASTADRTSKWVNPPAGSLSTIIGSGVVDVYRPVGGWAPMNTTVGRTYSTTHYQILGVGALIFTTTPQAAIGLAMNAMPAGTLLDVSFSIYVNYEVSGCGAGFMGVYVNGSLPANSSWIFTPANVVQNASYSGRVLATAPTNIPFQISLMVLCESTGGRIRINGENSWLSASIHQP